MAFPSPVQVWAEVHEKYARPYPPVAKTVFLACMRCMVPSSILMAITPTHAPVDSSMIKSSAKYSIK